MLMKVKVLIPWLLLTVLVGATFAQQAPTPLTDQEKLQAAEAFILLQNSQQQMVASPTWRAFQQRQQEYLAILQDFRKVKGAALNCTLNVKQEWNCPPPDTPFIFPITPEEPDVSDPTPAPK